MRVRTATLKGRGRDSCQRHKVLGRDAILAAVAKVFAQRGYHGTRHGSRGRGDPEVGKGTVYRYFPSKEELFLAAVDLGLRPTAAEAGGRRQRSPWSQGPWSARG